MNRGIRRTTQITGAIFAILVALFSVGVSYAHPYTSSAVNKDAVDVSKDADNATVPQESIIDKDHSFSHTNILFTTVDVVKSELIPVRAEFYSAPLVNAHVRNAIYSWPCIHAP